MLMEEELYMKKDVYNCHFIGYKENPKILLIHGMGFYWNNCFRKIIDELKSIYFLIIPELEGHHNIKEATNIKITECIEWLENILISNHINKIDAVYGISFGASIAVEFARRKNITVHNLILDGAQFVDQGMMKRLSSWIMAWQFKRVLSNKKLFSYIKRQMGYINKDEVAILKPMMCDRISFQTLEQSAYECYNYNINNGNEKIESKVWFICGSGENFALQSEKLISNAALLPIHKRVYQGKGHAEVLSQHPEEIVDIIKKCL